MNKKGGSTLVSKSWFYVGFLFLFTIAIVYSLHFVESREIRRVDFNELEDSVVINRVVSCLSESDFGELDMDKYSEEELRKCLDNADYSFYIELDGEPKIEIGDIGIMDESRVTKRYVLVEEEGKNLKVRYLKDAF